MMVAYSFKRGFVPAIEAGVKRQTVRGHRRRHARPGEPLQLYCAMRTRQCFKIIDDPVCTAVEPIAITLDPEPAPARITTIVVAGRSLTPSEMDAFARADGFVDGRVAGHDALQEMALFWRLNHTGEAFDGVVVLWRAAP